MGDLKDFTLSNARRFYSSKEKNLAAKGLKAKQGQELVKAFQTILASGQKPLKLQTDQGTEFLNCVFQKFLRENNIEFFTVKSGLKASVVERFHRTFKNKMYKYFTLTYIDVKFIWNNSYLYCGSRW